jgi:LEA14-like dessication related protein
MMKNKNFIYIGLGAAVLLYLLSKKSAANNLRVYFQTIGLKKASGLNLPTITATFRIVNPTSSTLTIDSLAGDLLVNNKLLSTLQNNEKFTVAAKSESLYTVNIKTPIFNALTTVIQLLKAKTKNIKVDFVGTANSGGILIPIDETVFVS